MEYLPTEIWMHIFTFLSSKQRAKCRQVCWKWNQIIEYMSLNQKLWQEECRREFPSVYMVAYYRRMPGLNWCNVYRSLSLWSKLDESLESKDELANASCCMDEIRDFQVLRNGIIGVQTRGSIKYYDLSTLKPAKRSAISGNYLGYSENDDTIVILGHNNKLFVQRKLLNDVQSEPDKTFENVKSFLLVGNNLVFTTLEDEVCLCDLNDRDIKNGLLIQANSSIMSISFDNGQIHLLTFQRDIFTIVDKELIFNYNLDSTSNLLNELKKFNFFENLDWRVYLQWMFILQHTIPQSPLRDIIVIKTYGEAVFVGSNWGVLSIYYAPYYNNEFDLFNCEPIKQYNFMDKYENPVISMCPIIQIYAIEGVDSHMVLIAMPKKIVMLTFCHSFMTTKSVELLSCEEIVNS